MFMSCDLLQLTERDVDGMFRGLYSVREPAFYHLLDKSSGESLWVTERFDLEVSQHLWVNPFCLNLRFSARILVTTGGIK